MLCPEGVDVSGDICIKNALQIILLLALKSNEIVLLLPGNNSVSSNTVLVFVLALMTLSSPSPRAQDCDLFRKGSRSIANKASK